MVVVTLAAVASMPIAAPVELAAADKSIRKSSGPSMNASLVIPRSITRSVNAAPSVGAIKVSVPVDATNETLALAAAALVTAVRKAS